MWHISYCHHVDNLEEIFTAPLTLLQILKSALSTLWIFRRSIIICSFIIVINLPPQNFVRKTCYYRLPKIKITNIRWRPLTQLWCQIWGKFISWHRIWKLAQKQEGDFISLYLQEHVRLESNHLAGATYTL